MRLRTAVPRSTWLLLGLLAPAALWLWLGAGDPGPVRGPLFPDLEAGVDRLTVRTPRGLTRLDRTVDGWRLTGTVSDRVDDEAVASLLSDLAAAEQSAPLDGDAGRSPAEYGLGAGSAREIVVEGPRGRRVVGVGLQNPALGHYHALDGDGRLVLVTEGLVALLDGLPEQVRARVLWPGFSRAAADTYVIRYAVDDTPQRFVRDGAGRWWWLSNAASLERIDPVLRAYQGAADDRRRVDAAGTWWRARDRVLGNLGALLEDLRVQSFPNLQGGSERAGGPEIRLLDGRGGHRVVFGPEAGEAELLAWRDDAPDPLVVLDRIRRDWTATLNDALHADVLTRGLAGVDSFALANADLGRAVIVPDADGGWRVPTADADDQRAGLVAGDLVFLLEHLVIRGLLPAPAEGEPLWSGAPAFRLDAWRTGPGAPSHEGAVFGIDGTSGRPAAWIADSRLLLEVAREGVISGRTFITRFGRTP